MTDDELERARIAQERRQLMSKPIPARPKVPGAPTPPPPLDELLQSRRPPAPELKFAPVADDPPGVVGSYEAFHDFVEILMALRKYPKPTQQRMLEALLEMLK